MTRAIDERSNESRIQGDRAIEHGATFDQTAGASQRQTAIEMRPGELGRKDRAYAKVGGRLDEPVLGKMAEAQGEPGPKSPGIKRNERTRSASASSS